MRGRWPSSIGHALDGMLKCIEAEPLEIFHYYRAVVDTNFKFWHDTNSEFYHDYMHYHNRQTSMLQPSYWEREYVPFPTATPRSATRSSSTRPTRGSPGASCRSGTREERLEDGGPLPGFTYNLRGSALRIDSVLPLGPTKTVIEYAGSGSRATGRPTARSASGLQHDLGPFGRNLHEDPDGCHGPGPPPRARSDLHPPRAGGGATRSTTRSACVTTMRMEQADGRLASDPYGELQP